ncbi:VanZ like family protein [Formivibrio citricus]|uniref:VanZ like family protein n=1 Tax=Formivibrio citricus TaxID=83765 RepID=A0A1I4VU23_9NEIS|nr:VanZ family protein [Formivibrio citricus]SFN04690.1 VanZ like family protein [Formivibrio citricus]
MGPKSTLPPFAYLSRHDAPPRFARYFLICTLLVILLVSLYPYTGWHHNGPPVLAFFFYPLPHYFTFFDNLINFIAYLPVGYCITLIRGRTGSAWLLAILSGLLFSSIMEFVQQFLPGRIASNLDILTNAAGAAAGGLLAMVLGSRRGLRLWQMWRHASLAPGAAMEWGFAWLLLWFVSQLDPTQPFLGVVVTPRGLPQPFVSPISDAALFLRLLEGSGMMLNFLGVALYVSALVRHTAQVPRAIVLTLGIALLAKMGFAGMLLKPAQFFAWINPNIVIGGLLGILLLTQLWRLARRLRALLALLSLSAAQVVSWTWPLAPQFADGLSLFRWHYGHLRHFSGLAALIGDLWPALASLWLFYIVLRQHREEKWIA